VFESHRTDQQQEEAMGRKSYLTCPHNRVQQFTDCCLDCGYNIWTTEKQYLEELRKEANESEHTSEIQKLERKLGIK
jgi:hypothetical protein